MIKKTFFDQLNEVNSQKGKKAKLALLDKYKSIELKMILDYTFHPGIIWDLPEGNPPYSPSKDSEAATTLRLAQEVRKLNRFFKIGPYANLSQKKKQSLFIDLLETVHPDDAKLLLAMKDKTLPFENIDKKLIADAFPLFTKNWETYETQQQKQVPEEEKQL